MGARRRRRQRLVKHAAARQRAVAGACAVRPARCAARPAHRRLKVRVSDARKRLCSRRLFRMHAASAALPTPAPRVKVRTSARRHSMLVHPRRHNLFNLLIHRAVPLRLPCRPKYMKIPSVDARVVGTTASNVAARRHTRRGQERGLRSRTHKHLFLTVMTMLALAASGMIRLLLRFRPQRSAVAAPRSARLR